MICSPIAGTKLRCGLETSAPMRGDGLHYRLCHADLATQAFRYQIVSFISVQADARRKTPVQQLLGAFSKNYGLGFAERFFSETT
jgi:hypothetical protein